MKYPSKLDKMMNIRPIKYIDPEEDALEQEAIWALSLSMEERLTEYCKHIIRNYAIAGIDVMNFPVKRDFYYIEDEE